jgi:hypothetical protein
LFSRYRQKSHSAIVTPTSAVDVRNSDALGDATSIELLLKPDILSRENSLQLDQTGIYN